MFDWLKGKIGRREEQKKLLWKREFTVVKNGLDEKQVVSFVNDLIAQYNASLHKVNPSPQTSPAVGGAADPTNPESNSTTQSRLELEAATTLLMQQYSESLYSGEVELAIDKPVDPRLVAKLHNCLQTIPEIKLLRASGSWEQGTTITVVLDKPISLIDIMSSKMPEVEALPEISEGDRDASGKVSLQLQKEKRPPRKIKLASKKA